MAIPTQKRTPHALRVLTARLPAPERIFHMNGVVFEIYKAKEQFQPHWNHAVLRTLVQEARKSFLRYGDVPLEDHFDQKAAVYLVRARYGHSVFVPSTPSIEEWITLRFIPAHGIPAHTEDLEVCLLHGVSVRQHIAQRFFRSEEAALQSTITASRLSGIKPFFSNAATVAGTLPNKQQHLALSSVLLHYVFFNTLQHDPYKKSIVTMMLHKKLLPKVTRIQMGHSAVSIPIPTVQNFLGEETAVRIDRSVLSYAYPSYWLTVKDVLRLCVALTTKKLLPIDTPQYYLRTAHSFKALEELYKRDSLAGLTELKYLGRLLTVDGMLHGGRISGPMLRKYIDKYVSDAAQLHVVPVAVWVAQIEHVLSLVKSYTPQTLMLPTYAHTHQYASTRK